MQLKYIGKPECLLISDVAMKALKEAFAGFNIDIKRERGSFDSTYATLKFQFALKTANGTVASKESEDFKRWCNRYGLQPTDLGRRFSARGERYEIVGLKTKAHAYPILATKIGTGKCFKFGATTVKTALAVEYDD
jgi:hypothetical protein